MKITVKESEMVRPAAETPSVDLWISNADVVINPFHHPIVYFYRRPTEAENFFDHAVLKEALRRVLVPFYPFAGRLKNDGDGRTEIHCNADGALLVDADSDGNLPDSGDFMLTPDLIRLAPTVDNSHEISAVPLVLLQVTRFKCGGVSLGASINHIFCDGFSLSHFMNAWSNMARCGGLDTTIPPFIDRTPLRADNPPRPKFNHIEYHPPPALKGNASSDIQFAVFKLTADQVNSIKVKAKGEGSGIVQLTTFEAVAAHIWRCACMARNLPDEQETWLYIVTDGRSRLRPPLPQGYLGNALFMSVTLSTYGELRCEPLQHTAIRIKETLARMDNEYLRSVIDYMELQSDISALRHGAHNFGSPNLAVTSWVRLPVYEADFGWGRPIFMVPAKITCEGKSILLSNSENDGSMLVAILLHADKMDSFRNLLYNLETNRARSAL